MTSAAGSSLGPLCPPEGRPAPGPRLEALRGVAGTVAALWDAGRRPVPASMPARALGGQRLAQQLSALNGLKLRTRGSVSATPSILVGNHLGYWDALLVASVVPLVAVAKSELAEWPLLGRCGQALGTLYVRRGDVHHGARVLRRAMAWLAAGVHVLNFPEGTTTDGSEVLPFRRGVFGAAALARVPVVPLALRLSRKDAAWVGGEAFLPHYVRHWRRGGQLEASLHFGPPLWPQDFPTAEALAQAARAQVEALLGGTA